MSDAIPPERASERLESWKEIAAYLKRDVRTARRWEKLEGLPVHRHVHHKLASVYAFTQELDAWRANRATAAAVDDSGGANTEARVRAPFPPLLIGAVVAAAIVATGAALIITRGHQVAQTRTTAVSTRISGRLLAAATGEGGQPTLVTATHELTALAMSPDGAHLYFTEREHRRLRTVETRTHRLLDDMHLPGKPNQMVLSPDGRVAYMGTEEGDVLRLDLARRSIETLATGLSPARDLALTEDGGRLFVTAVFNGLHVIDTRSRTVRAIPTVQCPMYAALVPGKDLAYISYQCGGPGGRSGHDAIDVRVASSGAAKTTIAGPPQVGSVIRASPDGAQVWIDGADACASTEYDHVGCPTGPSGLINVYRVDDNFLLGSIALAGADTRPGEIAFFPDASRAILGGPMLKVLDARSLRVVEEAPLTAPGRAVFSPDAARAYVPLGDDERLVMFDLVRDRCVSPPSALAAWWTGDGHANDVREDNRGELRDGATFVPAHVGQGFRFDGARSHLRVPRLSVAAEQFSAALWMKPERRGSHETLLVQGGENDAGWRVTRNADSTIGFCVFERGGGCSSLQTVTTAAATPAGEWTHVAAVASGRRLSLFVNGNLSGTRDVAARPPIQTPDFHIGADVDQRAAYAGVLDEVQLYRTALTADMIRGQIAAGRSGLCYR